MHILVSQYRPRDTILQGILPSFVFTKIMRVNAQAYTECINGG